jgi:VanZ family protein
MEINMLKKAILWSIIVIIISSIFLFSSETGRVSQDRSYKITEFVAKESEKVIDKHIGLDNISFDRLHYYIRKSGHFFEYMLLSIFIAAALGKSKNGLFISSIIELSLCIALACIDEWIQTFTAGRSGRLRDVFIDGSGALIGIVLYNLVVIVLEGMKSNLKKVLRRKMSNDR